MMMQSTATSTTIRGVVDASLTSELLSKKDTAVFLEAVTSAMIRSLSSSSYATTTSGGGGTSLDGGGIIPPLYSNASAAVVDKRRSSISSGSPSSSYLGTPTTGLTFAAPSVTTATADAAWPSSLLSGPNLVARCRTFCSVFNNFSAKEFDAFRRKLNLMHRAKQSAFLTVDEAVDVGHRATTMELNVAPVRISEYVLIAAVIAFSGIHRVDGAMLEHIIYTSMQNTLPIATDNASSPPQLSSTIAPQCRPFYRVLQQDTTRMAMYRLPPFNTPSAVLRAAFFTVCVWEDNPLQWPMLIDPHNLVVSIWVNTLPRAVVVSYETESVCAVFDAYRLTDVVLILTNVPHDVSDEFETRICSGRGGGGVHNNTTTSPSSISACNPAFKLLLVFHEGLAPPAWAQPANVSVMHVAETIDCDVAAQLITEETFRLACKAEAQQLEEVYAETLEYAALAEASEMALLQAAVDPTDQASAATAACRQHRLATQYYLQRSSTDYLQCVKMRAEYRIVGEVSARLYGAWNASPFRKSQQIAASQSSWSSSASSSSDSILSLQEFMASVFRPAVVQHLTEGSKHYTRCKTEAAQEVASWSHRLCERQLIDANRRRPLPESHNSVSLALHVVKCFIFGRSKDNAYPHSAGEQCRRMVVLWDASLLSSQGGESEGLSVPKALVDHSLSLFPASTEAESDVFARLQRLLLTLTSIRTLLMLDGYSDSLKEFTEWLGHVATTKSRLIALEEEVFGALLRGLLLLSDASRSSGLVDALSLFAVLRELLVALKAVPQTLRCAVPKRKAAALGRLLADFNEECHATESEAQSILKSLLNADSTVNPNKVLEVRSRVAELQSTKAKLLLMDPTGRGGSGVPLMRTVDSVASLCLPSVD